MIRAVLFLLGLVGAVLFLIAMFTKANPSIERGKLLEGLALAFGLAGVLSDLHKSDT